MARATNSQHDTPHDHSSTMVDDDDDPFGTEAAEKSFGRQQNNRESFASLVPVDPRLRIGSAAIR